MGWHFPLAPFPSTKVVDSLGLEEVGHRSLEVLLVVVVLGVNFPSTDSLVAYYLD